MKIGVTEAGDAGLDLSWISKLPEVDAAIIITKKLTDECIQGLVKNADKCILHNTITGYGGTVLEPNVPTAEKSLKTLYELVRDEGFPASQVVVRVDPIIPTPKGINRAKRVITSACNYGFDRFRVSVIDMYPHVRERFTTAGLPLPYLDGFSPIQPMLDAVDAMLVEVKKNRPNAYFESCAETLQNAISIGCVSSLDLMILDIPTSALGHAGSQRPGCKCASCKTELLQNKCRCGNGCLYCYWK